MKKNPTVVFQRPGETVLEDHELPVPHAGELVIETRFTLISTGTELTILGGQFPADSAWGRYGKFPFVPGYANVGTVVDAAPDVDRTWIGRTVASHGWHARYVTSSTEAAFPIQRKLADEHVLFFPIAQIVLNGIRRARLTGGEAVAVYGLGLLGQLTVRCCRLFGAKPVFAIDTAQSRLQRLPRDNAVRPLDATSKELISIVEKETKGRMVDIVFEITGAQDLIPDEFKLLKRQGRFVVLSSPRGKTSFDFHDLCNAPSFLIIGAHGGSAPKHETPDNPWTSARNAEYFFDLLADGELDMAPLISHRVRSSDAPAIYAQLLKDRSEAMGVIIEW